MSASHRRPTRATFWRRRLAVVVALGALATGAVVATHALQHDRQASRAASPRPAPSPTTLARSLVARPASTVRPLGSTPGALGAAVDYATGHAMTSAIAVLDTRTGSLRSAGAARQQFPAASVVKVLIATRLLLEDRLHGRDDTLARLMITRSDNDAADTLYPLAGGDDLLPWLSAHYDVDLGAGPAHPGLWGSTRITAEGLARFYGRVRKDATVWPWLSTAMHAHEARTKNGEPNDFGLAAVPGAAVKNGWNTEDDPAHPRDTDINTTGFVHADRYAVVILAQGPGRLYYTGGERVVTAQVQLLFASPR